MKSINPILRSLCIAVSLSLLPHQAVLRAEGPYQPTWESLATYPIPDWFQDGKFGIYTHWGIYSVPAHITEWYPHGMYMKDGFRNKDFYGWHTEHFGTPCAGSASLAAPPMPPTRRGSTVTARAN